MRVLLLAAALALPAAAPGMAQTHGARSAETAAAQPLVSATGDASGAAVPRDVATPEAIVEALYEVISGDAGAQRDWDRFRALFHPTARLIPTGGNRTGQGVLRSVTPEEYIVNSEPMLMADGFHERELARKIDHYGRIAHVWSTYDSRRSLSDPEPFTRGINSIQLFHDGARWWIVSVYWQSESELYPVPAGYLPSGA